MVWSVQVVHLPFAVIVHAIEAVPLRVQLCEGVPDLCYLSGRRIPNGIGLTLVDRCDLLTNALQILFDILEKDTCKMRQRDAINRRKLHRYLGAADYLTGRFCYSVSKTNWYLSLI